MPAQKFCGRLGIRSLNFLWLKNMSEYNRTTQECVLSQLHPELLQAVQNYFREHESDDLQAETLLCCQTISRRKNSDKATSWLSDQPDATIHSGIVLTPQRLIWVQHGDRSGTRLNAADLNSIRAKYYTSTFMKDGGLEIIGYIGNSNSRVRGYIAMGIEPAVQKFCEAVKQATLKENPPPKGWLKWLAGDW
jgi:hypothetical protein